MRYLKIILPILLLAGAFIGAGLIAGGSETIESVETPAPLRHVEAVSVELHEISLDVAAFGTLELRTAIDVTASVAGPVIHVAQSLEAGEIVRRGEILARLDEVDFEVVKTRAEAAIAQAQLELAQEEAEAQAALEEWVGEGDPGSLVTREPQLERARANLAARRSELALAEKDLERSVIRSPFDALVRERHIGRGQYIQPGQVLASIQEISFAEIRVPLTEAQIAALDPAVMRPPLRDKGPKALVESELAGLRTRRWGRVTRTEGALDDASRMLTLIVRVDDPLGLRGQTEPLVPGQFVDVKIGGRRSTQAALVPRSALLSGERVLVVEDGVLQSRQVELAQVRGETAVITSGLSAGDLVNISPALGAVDGVAVETSRIAAPGVETLGLTEMDGPEP